GPPSSTRAAAASDGTDGDTGPSRIVSVQTRPAGARVELDGVFLGTTPLDVKAPHAAAPATLLIEAKGFRAVERTVQGSEDVVLSLSLEPARQATKPTSRRATKPETPSTKPKPPPSKPDDQLDIRGAR
ncbi:MAG TPA: PEGA domain-containing protein, partial [Kofleriaceae bacterium]|nr:PEGA domain-containing protein [Kofleriaceae bacterium]